MIDRMPGAYQIRNKRNRRIYIGCTVDFKARWANHKAKLRSGKHPNKQLQNDWNRYGEGCFVFEPIYYVFNRFDMHRAETQIIKFFREQGNLYNIVHAFSEFDKYMLTKSICAERRAQRAQAQA